MRTRVFLRGAILTLIICAFALVLTTCGGREQSSVPPSLGYGGQASTEVSLDEALAELDALETPEGVDAELFQQLKNALREALIHQVESRLSNRDSNNADSRLENRASRHDVKFVSAPPTGPANRVDDLELTEDGGTFTLTWHYRNLGDYDQNGTVGITDITPLAIHFGEDATPENEWIDGDADGRVLISDVTPLAINFGVDCAGYLVQGQVAQGSWTEINSISLSLAQTEAGRLHFSYDLGALAHDFYRVVPYDASELGGVRSVVVPESASQPPNILGISPHGGTTGEPVAFNATVEGSAHLSYAWDFGGGATPNTSTEASPTVTLGTPNTYSAALTATNAFGEDTYPFTLTVTGQSTYSVSGHVEKDIGGGLQEVTLTLTPGNYSAVTNSSGDYTITGVPNGSYTLTPNETGWSFDPPTHSVTVNNGNVTGKDFTASEEAAGEWHIVTVGSEGGDGTSLCVVNSNPAISYCDDTGCDLKYVRASDASGASWGIPITVDSEGEVGDTMPLCVVNGHPAISYNDCTNGDLKYVRATDANGSSWGTPVTVNSEGDAGVFPSLAVVNANPAISYVDYTDISDLALKYVRASDANGSGWGTPVTVDSEGDVGAFSSLAIVNGNPAISYFDGTNVGLKYVRASNTSGSAWGTPVIVDSEAGEYTSLAVVNGNPAISYAGEHWELMYVRASDASGSAWGTPVIVDSEGSGENADNYTSLAVINGSPAISYWDLTNRKLKFAIYH